MFFRLVYSSANVDRNETGSKLQQLREILASAQKHNGENNVTGFLVFDGQTFLQILEGKREDVISTYDRIKKDPRHKAINLMEMENISERQFPNWQMGGSMRSLDAQEIYLSHGIGNPINPKSLTANKVVSLALDLQHFEQQRLAKS